MNERFGALWGRERLFGQVSLERRVARRALGLVGKDATVVFETAGGDTVGIDNYTGFSKKDVHVTVKVTKKEDEDSLSSLRPVTDLSIVLLANGVTGIGERSGLVSMFGHAKYEQKEYRELDPEDLQTQEQLNYVLDAVTRVRREDRVIDTQYNLTIGEQKKYGVIDEKIRGKSRKLLDESYAEFAAYEVGAQRLIVTVAALSGNEGSRIKPAIEIAKHVPVTPEPTASLSTVVTSYRFGMNGGLYVTERGTHFNSLKPPRKAEPGEREQLWDMLSGIKADQVVNNYPTA